MTETTLTVGRIGYMVGVGFVVLGGLVAAVTGPLQLARGSWLTAYLVLICGVAQCVISSQSSYLDGSPSTSVREWPQLVMWNAGNALVIVGALTTVPLVADTGGIILLCALVVTALRTRGASRRARAATLRVLYVTLAFSVPIGLVLTHVRAAQI